MTLEEVKAALAPFARFAEVFTHNMLGVDYEEFYKKTATVNGQDREFVLKGSDFDKAKDAFDFLSGIEAKQATKGAPEPQEPQKNAEPEATGETKPAPDAGAEAAASKAEGPAAAGVGGDIPETKQEPMPATEAPAKKGKK